MNEDSLFGDNDELMGGLEHLNHVDESRMTERHLQHADLLQHLVSTILALPPLAQELRRVVQSGQLVLTPLDHSKLASVNKQTYVDL